MTNPAIRLIKSKILYRGKIATLSLDTCRTAEGRVFLRETIRHPASAVMVPILPGGRVLLIRQFRHAAGRVLYELPAGTTEPGEPPLRCARRELAEETGYEAKHWKRLCAFYPAPGISTERMVLYRAWGLSPARRPASKDEDEYITPAIVSGGQALRWVRENKIVDAKTLIGLVFGLGRV